VGWNHTLSRLEKFSKTMEENSEFGMETKVRSRLRIRVERSPNRDDFCRKYFRRNYFFGTYFFVAARQVAATCSILVTVNTVLPASLLSVPVSFTV
jgi:hypothetical protein